MTCGVGDVPGVLSQGEAAVVSWYEKVCTTKVVVAWVGMGRASPSRGEPSWLHQLLQIDPCTLVLFWIL